MRATICILFLFNSLNTDFECSQHISNLNFFKNLNFHCHIWIWREIYIQMSTHKPIIGEVVHEIGT